MPNNLQLIYCCTVPQMLPFLGPVLGRGKIGNFLIRNKWRNYEAIKKISNTPILMLSAGQVSTSNDDLPNTQVKGKKCVDLFYVLKYVRSRS